MIFKNKKIQKVIATLMIIAVLSPAAAVFIKPKPAEAFLDPVVAAFTKLTSIFTGKTAVESTISTGVLLKNLAKDVLKQVLMVIAKRALATMTKSTVNWINNGFHGAPLFVQNTDSFFKDITKFEVKDLISIVGYDPQRFPFGKQFALNTIDAYKRQLGYNAEYSLSRVVNDPVLLNNYRTEFNTGGWDGFLLNTQYPQNNPLGSQILLTNELSRRLNINDPSTAPGKIQATLNQSQGFLSPQKCVGPNADAYNATIANQFQRPTFNFKPLGEPPAVTYTQNSDGEYIADQKSTDARSAFIANYNDQKAAAQKKWTETNVCQGGLVTTTPGSVAAGLITKALGVNQDQASLGAALGNSLSAIFDTLLNKFLGSPQDPGGLSSLASSSNNPPPDDFSYDGQTLGSPATNNNGNVDPFSGPDEEIILDKFKKAVDEGIINTLAEKQLLDNSDPNNYGIAQMLSLTWPEAQQLDICTPGPDLGWEDRLKDEMDRNSQKLNEKASDENGGSAYRATVVLKELKFAVDFFKDWIETAMIKSGGTDLGLPNSIIYVDAVNQITDLSQQTTELTTNRRSKTDAIARLGSIKTGLAVFTSQPLSGSQGEKDLITLRNQYDSIQSSISNPVSIANTQTELETAKERYSNYKKLTAECTKARVDAGWNVPASGNWLDALDSNKFVSKLPKIATGKITIVLKDFAGVFTGIPVPAPATGEEQEQFCVSPSYGGYTHDSFKQLFNTPQYPDLPMVNARKVYTYDSGLFGWGSSDVNITIKCNAIYRANILDYKGDLPSLPGLNKPIQPPPAPDTGTPGLDNTDPTQNNGGNNNNGSNPPPVDCGTDIACG